MEKAVISAAERQHGLVSRAQLREAGVRPRSIKHRQAVGELVEMRPAVYRVAGAPITWDQGLCAVLLAVGGAASSHSSGLRLYGVDKLDRNYEITTVRDRRVRLPGVVSHRSGLWLPEDHHLRRGFAVTSPARLVVDLSGRYDADRLGRIVDDLLRRHLLRLPKLALTNARLTSAPGRRPGVVDEVLAARLTGYTSGDSDLEAEILRALAAAGLPMPTAQHRVLVGGRRYRVDLAYPAMRLAIEIDSWAYHRWRSAFDRDRARRNDLTLAGYRVLQVTDGMTHGEIVGLVTEGLATSGLVGAVERARATQLKQAS
jgi:very-short-patch-repair endonuclease